MLKKSLPYFTAILLALSGAGVLVFQSCERDDICPQDHPKTPDAFIQFKTLSNGNLVDADLLNTDFVGIGANTSAPINGTSQKYNNISLPLDLEAESVSFRIIYKNTAPQPPYAEDTLTITYKPSLQFISKACGFRYIFNQVNATCTRHVVSDIRVNILEFTPPGQLINSKQITATLLFLVP